MSQATQQLMRKVIGAGVMGLGLILILWGLGQYFQKYDAGLIVFAFGVMVGLGGYAIWQQA